MRPSVLLPPFGKAPADSPRTTRVRRSILAAAAALALWALAAPLAARFLIVHSEPRRADAVIVLSGSAVYAERLRHAVRLYHEGRAPSLVLTDDGLVGRWSRQRQSNPRSIERGSDILRTSGVPADRVVMLPQRISSTHDEALAVRMYARTQRIRSLVIVTSPYHARRALWIFNRVLAGDGVSVGVDPVPTGDQSPTPLRWWLSGIGWQSVAAEYPKFLYYLIAYR